MRSFLGWNNYIAGMRKHKADTVRFTKVMLEMFSAPYIYIHHTETPMDPYSELTYPPSPGVHRNKPTHTLTDIFPTDPLPRPQLPRVYSHTLFHRFRFLNNSRGNAHYFPEVRTKSQKAARGLEAKPAMHSSGAADITRRH